MNEPRIGRASDEAAVVALLESEELEPDFVAAEFFVLEEAGAVVACARLKPLGDASHELASVAVRADRRGAGFGRRVVLAALERAPGVVHALALEPAFFERLGFRRVESPPAPLLEKAAGLCAGSGFVPMSRARRDSND